MIRLILILVFLALPVAAGAQALRAVPFDEGPRDAGFAAWRAALVEAVRARDLDRIVAAASEHIHLDFGGGSGPEMFRENLVRDPAGYSEEYRHLADRHRDEYWASLEWVLSNGGAFEGPDAFEAPYTWLVRVPDDMDPYATWFVTGARVRLRDGPGLDAGIIGHLSYDVVTALEGPGIDRPPDPEPGWGRIRLADGREGWVRTDYLRSQIDYRARFERHDDGWRMVMFIAGD